MGEPHSLGVMNPPRIRVGVGGWTYEPWRGSFYPADLPQTKELAYASRRLTAIEINGTYYSSQKPATFAKWREETPEGFVFSLKASRFATNRRVLAEAGESIARFVGSGIAELGPKLGPIVWQFAPGKRFEPKDFAAFVEQLPAQVDGLALRHVLDVRHPSFMCADYLALARRHGCATVFTDSDDYPSFADPTADFVYARLMRTRSELAEGVEPAQLDALAACARCWHAGFEPSGLPRVEPPPAPTGTPRDVFLYFISGAKEKAPAAAMALLRRLG
ncbi:MAG TPA: DUF72 domain-containing protein [Methylibium sp.]|uniref:DUF72 domain-containing protein n=1 Tax=Methylibium sp. TaxID=2067992 RepID=UPI002DC04B52|nr:DUF72 domain-containing protein [Methylibium sp.]HEU4459142.1 DUF72 domain-containing protein [Methylibium sp.]